MSKKGPPRPDDDLKRAKLKELRDEIRNAYASSPAHSAKQGRRPLSSQERGENSATIKPRQTEPLQPVGQADPASARYPTGGQRKAPASQPQGQKPHQPAKRVAPKHPAQKQLPASRRQEKSSLPVIDASVKGKKATSEPAAQAVPPSEPPFKPPPGRPGNLQPQRPAAEPAQPRELLDTSHPVRRGIASRSAAGTATGDEDPAASKRQALERKETTDAPKGKLAPTRPFAAFERMIALRYLGARRKDGFISVIAGFSLIGIAIGVAALIIVMAVMTGFREEFTKRILGVNAHINVVPVADKFAHYDEMAGRLGRIRGVVRAVPIVEGQVMASTNANNIGVLVRGIRPGDLRTLELIARPEESSGSIDDFYGDQGIAIGQRAAYKLGVRVGDKITLISPNGSITPFGTMPRSKSYPVAYIFKSGVSTYDEVYVYMPLKEAQIYFNREYFNEERGEVVPLADNIEIMVENPHELMAYKKLIIQAIPEHIQMFDWKTANSTFIGALDLERKAMSIILGMIIFVAALNIISGLVMLVKDKGRDVAILRTMGMGRRSVMRVFFMCGAAIGVVGTLIGVTLGVAVALNIGPIQRLIESITGAETFPEEVYYLSEVPAVLRPQDVVFTVLLALGLSFLATIYPAHRAARLDPVEALRYE